MEQNKEAIKSQEHSRLYAKTLGRIALGVGGAGIVLGGGILGTQITPHTTSIDGLKITTTISPDIHERGKIFMRTPVGSVDIDSKYWLAPGIEVNPEVTPQGADQYNEWLERVNDPQSRDEILSTIATDQALNLALRFGVGAGAASLGLAGLYELYKRRENRSFKRAAIVGMAGTAIGLTEILSIGGAYYDSNVNALHATGIIAQAIGTPNALREIDNIQASEIAPYLNGWLSLGKLAQEKIAAPEKQTPTAINLLFVSDIHGRNRYPLMKDIIDEQHINAVVDTGDLINFGFPQELSLTNLTGGIKSLGIPYLYVTGNHDAQGSYDFSVIDALKKGAHNVIPLQPNATTYNEVSVDGYTIGGMDDRAHYYTDGAADGSKAMEAPYVKRFNQTFHDTKLDLAITHEPAASEQMDVSMLTANGHTHRAAFTGNNINPGTFTGGDELRSAGSYTEASIAFEQCKAHIKNAEDCTPPSEKPSSYAILSIGEDCRPNTLTIYQYTIQNGRVVDTVVTAYGLSNISSPDTKRTCDVSRGISVRSIQAEN